MKTFSELTGAEGIDKYLEAVPYIDNIRSDKELMNKLKDEHATYEAVGALIVKTHMNDLEKIFKILGERPSGIPGLIAVAAKIFFETVCDEDISGFFTYMTARVESQLSGSAQENSEE